MAGKSVFLAWAPVVLLGEEQTTAFDYGRDEYILFSREGIIIWPKNQPPTSDPNMVIVGLSNSSTSHNPPASGLQDTPACYIVQASSPAPNQWKQWTKERGGLLTFVDVWSEAELEDFA